VTVFICLLSRCFSVYLSLANLFDYLSYLSLSIFPLSFSCLSRSLFIFFLSFQ
jgi:hypothetical protein